MSIISKLVNFIDRYYKDYDHLATITGKVFQDPPRIDTSGVLYSSTVETKAGVNTCNCDSVFLRTSYCGIFLQVTLNVGLNETKMKGTFSFFPYNGYLKQDQEYWSFDLTLPGSRYPFTYIECEGSNSMTAAIDAINVVLRSEKSARLCLAKAIAESTYTADEIAAGRKHLEGPHA